MKIGYLYYGIPNTILSTEARQGASFGVHSMVNIPKLWMDEPAASCDIVNPDMDLLNSMEALFCSLDKPIIPYLVDLMPRLSSKVIINLEGGLEEITKWCIEDVESATSVMDMSDLVTCVDSRAISLLRSLTSTKVIFWPLPYQVNLALELLNDPEDVDQYDILIPFGLTDHPSRMRNTLSSVIVAREACKRFDDFNTVAIFEKTDEETQSNVRKFLGGLGCNHFTVIPYVDPETYIKMVAKCKLVVNMDRRRAAGKVAVECALAKKVAVLTNQSPYVYDLYGPQLSCDPFDIDRAVELAAGIWHTEGCQELLYNKALEFAMEPKRRALEEALKETD